MRTAFLSILMAACVILPAAAQKKTTTSGKQTKPATTNNAPASTSLALGSAIPGEDEMLRSPKGEATSLGRAKTTKGLLVMFSCNTCPYVIKSQKRTNEAMYLANKLGIGMVIINSNEAQRSDADSDPSMIVYADQQGYTVPYVRDDMSAMANRFGASRTPEVFLFDGKGVLVYKGAMEDNPATPQESTKFYLRDAMNAMSAGQPIAIKETKSIGCSIKRMN